MHAHSVSIHNRPNEERNAMLKGPKKKNDTTTAKTDSTSVLSFEATLWAAVDAFRNDMDAAEYRHMLKLVRRIA